MSKPIMAKATAVWLVDNTTLSFKQIADFCGFRGIEAYKVEAACASGAAAVRMGYLAVAGGLADRVIVVGVEKMTDEPGEVVTRLRLLDEVWGDTVVGEEILTRAVSELRLPDLREHLWRPQPRRPQAAPPQLAQVARKSPARRRHGTRAGIQHRPHPGAALHAA